MARARDLDGLRLVTAVTVILLHAGEFPELPDGWGGVIRVSLRWCVPFFFLVSGYFLYRPGAPGPVIRLGRTVRVARMLAVGSLIYLPLLIAKGDMSLGEVSPALLLLGTWYHLWFLAALVVALLGIAAVAPARGGPPVLDILAGVALVSFLALDMAASIDGGYGGAMDLARQTQGLCFVWLGYRLARAGTRPGAWTLGALILGGAALTLVDAFVLARFGGQMSWRQCSLGAALVAVGLLLWGAKGTVHLPEWMARMGREHSLGIYILHPLFVAAAGIVVSEADGGARPTLVIAALALAVTLAVVEGLGRFAPGVKAVIDGALPGERDPDTVPDQATAAGTSRA